MHDSALTNTKHEKKVSMNVELISPNFHDGLFLPAELNDVEIVDVEST